jgi:hypothetical protein
VRGTGTAKTSWDEGLENWPARDRPDDCRKPSSGSIQRVQLVDHRAGHIRPKESFLSVNTPNLSANTPNAVRGDAVIDAPAARPIETKPAFRTTEFAAYLTTVIGVLVASALVGDSDGRGDVFLADTAWLYVTLLTIGYLISRGLAKAGSRGRRDA